MILVRHGQSEFNVIYGQTRQDPGIEDPAITPLGADQARAAAAALRGQDIRRLVCSPYRRALQTASIIAEVLDLSLTVDMAVREHYAFSCDIGSPRSILERDWPALDFAHLDERWWPHEAETDDIVSGRARGYFDQTLGLADRDHVAVVTHWGFIRGMTGLRVTNGTVVRVGRDGRGVVVDTPDP